MTEAEQRYLKQPSIDGFYHNNSKSRCLNNNILPFYSIKSDKKYHQNADKKQSFLS